MPTVRRMPSAPTYPLTLPAIGKESTVCARKVTKAMRSNASRKPDQTVSAAITHTASTPAQTNSSACAISDITVTATLADQTSVARTTQTVNIMPNVAQTQRARSSSASASKDISKIRTTHVSLTHNSATEPGVLSTPPVSTTPI